MKSEYALTTFSLTAPVSKIQNLKDFLFVIAATLGACGYAPPDPKATEEIRISTYHPLPRSYVLKTTGDWALLESGENIHIRSPEWLSLIGKTALPIPEKYIEKETAEWEKKSNKKAKQGGIEGKLDRINGVICIENQCARLHSICPSAEELRQGKKCSPLKIDK